MISKQGVYLVGAQFMKYEDCKRFQDYQKALDEASFVSRCAAGILIEIRVDENDSKGELMGVCQLGKLLHSVQIPFLEIESKEERKIRRVTGKDWWLLLGNFTKKIYGLEHRLIPRNEEEEEELKVLKSVRQTLLDHLERAMPEKNFQAAKWQFVDCQYYKNRKPEKPDAIKFSEGSCIRKYYTDAHYATGRIAFDEGWVLHESAMLSMKQFLEAKANEPDAKATSESTKTRRVTSKQPPKEDPDQLPLFV